MNWDAIGAIGQMLGSVAVLVTLVYLALQVRHAKEAVELGTKQAASNHQLALMGMANQLHQSILANRDHAGFLVKLKGDEELSPIEREWRQAHVYWLLNFWQATQNAHDLDLLPAGFFETMRADVRTALAVYPGMREQAKSILASYANVAAMTIFRPILDDAAPTNDRPAAGVDRQATPS